jgi:hypothetical protein
LVLMKFYKVDVVVCTEMPASAQKVLEDVVGKENQTWELKVSETISPEGDGMRHDERVAWLYDKKRVTADGSPVCVAEWVRKRASSDGASGPTGPGPSLAERTLLATTRFVSLTHWNAGADDTHAGLFEPAAPRLKGQHPPPLVRVRALALPRCMHSLTPSPVSAFVVCIFRPCSRPHERTCATWGRMRSKSTAA